MGCAQRLPVLISALGPDAPRKREGTNGTAELEWVEKERRQMRLNAVRTSCEAYPF